MSKRQIQLLALLVVSSAVVAAPCLAQKSTFPWTAGDVPPSIAGLQLRDLRSTVDSLFGPPSRVQSLGEGVDALFYDSLGVTVTYASEDGVAMIDLITPSAGAIDSIRVGDSAERVIGRWGAPHQQDKEVGLFIAGSWVVVVRLDKSRRRVAMLTLGLLAG